MKPHHLGCLLLALVCLSVLPRPAAAASPSTVISATVDKPPIDFATFPGSTTLLNGNYKLYWRFDNNFTITLAVDVATSGWVGFGISDPNGGGMLGADIVTMNATKLNDTHTVGYLSDRHATAQALPIEDDCNNVNLTVAWQSGARSVFSWTRLLDTGDKTQDRIISAGLTGIIAAYSADNSPQVAYHQKNRAFAGVTFFDTAKSFVQSHIPEIRNEKLYNFTHTNPPVPISANETVYKCSGFIFSPPPVTNSQGASATTGHVVRISPNLDPNSIQYVHHYVIHVCRNGTGYQSMLNNPVDCYTNTGPNSPIADCVGIIYAWAPGIGSLEFPPEAGLVYGDPNDPMPMTFLALEVHYNNPTGVAPPGVSDTSGIIIYYTPDKRPQDAGFMVVGDPSVSSKPIPIGNPLTDLEYTCPGECTSNWAHSVHFFASFLHTHGYGVQIVSTVTTPSGQLRDLDRVDRYSFEFQRITAIDVVVNPGDRINTHCVYDSSVNKYPSIRPGAKEIVFGLSTYDEMCMNFLWYYPRLPANTGACGLAPRQAGGDKNTMCGTISASGEFTMSSVKQPAEGSYKDPTSVLEKTFGKPGNGTCSGKKASSASKEKGVGVWAFVITTVVMLVTGF